MKPNINRRKFLGIFGCSFCSLMLPSCTTVPITERKQLALFSEARINAQAAAAYENFKSKTKLISPKRKITVSPNMNNVKQLNKRCCRSP